MTTPNEITDGLTHITLDQFAALWSIDAETLLRWIFVGTVPRPEIIDHLIRWKLATLQQWEAAGRPQSGKISYDDLTEIRVFYLMEKLSKKENQHAQ